VGCCYNNTLVGVAVAANKFDAAESILRKHTITEESLGQKYKTSKWHPNVEAYTELLNGYAKAGYLSKALSTLKTMRERGVKPNEITYTCIIGALAKSGKTEQAEKLMTFMSESDGIRPGVVTYNALFTGMLVEKHSNGSDIYNPNLNVDVDKALEILSSMTDNGIKLNAITITIFVEALGRCIPSRLDQAEALVQSTCDEGIIPFGTPMVSTALIRACGNGSDLEGAISAYESILKPDLIAFNALLDTCCRCTNSKRAIQLLERNKQRREDGLSHIIPDVASYGSIIACLLKVGTPAASNAMKKLYNEMKTIWAIAPDHILIDAIVTAMIRSENSLGYQESDASFASVVLRDASTLDWPHGYLERRKALVQKVFRGKLKESWKDSQDPLFKKKNWNTIDSGFKLWGQNTPEKNNKKSVDAFLESKDWNDIDSGFRIL
jgi:pentatricopeptide repeat protein